MISELLAPWLPLRQSPAGAALFVPFSAAFPFSLLNLAYGLSEVSLWDYCLD